MVTGSCNAHTPSQSGFVDVIDLFHAKIVSLCIPGVMTVCSSPNKRSCRWPAALNKRSNFWVYSMVYFISGNICPENNVVFLSCRYKFSKNACRMCQKFDPISKTWRKSLGLPQGIASGKLYVENSFALSHNADPCVDFGFCDKSTALRPSFLLLSRICSER